MTKIIVSHETADGEKTSEGEKGNETQEVSLCIFEICSSFALLIYSIYMEGMAPLHTSQAHSLPLIWFVISDKGNY